MHITNYERGQHVTFLSELKDVINNRNNDGCIKKKNNRIRVKIQEKIETPLCIPANNFVSSLIEGKRNLKNVTPPVERKIF